MVLWRGIVTEGIACFEPLSFGPSIGAEGPTIRVSNRINRTIHWSNGLNHEPHHCHQNDHGGSTRTASSLTLGHFSFTREKLVHTKLMGE